MDATLTADPAALTTTTTANVPHFLAAIVLWLYAAFCSSKRQSYFFNHAAARRRVMPSTRRPGAPRVEDGPPEMVCDSATRKNSAGPHGSRGEALRSYAAAAGVAQGVRGSQHRVGFPLS